MNTTIHFLSWAAAFVVMLTLTIMAAECRADDDWEEWNRGIAAGAVVFPSSQPLDNNQRYGTDTSKGNDWYLDRPKRETTVITPINRDTTVIQRGMDIQNTTTCINVEGTVICQ